MDKQLRERRDRAADRHDAALNRDPTREGDTFRRELQGVVDELTAVARAADTPASDPVEVAKTYRWLGDAYFDLARGTDEVALTQGSQAYQRSEELLSGCEAPVEKAKLIFNYANTLRGLSQGFDVGLLEAAQTRYEQAARTFRSHHLPDLAAAVEEQLHTIDPQLRLAHKQAELQKGYRQLGQLTERLGGSTPVERDRIASELKQLKEVPSRGNMTETLKEAFDAISEQVGLRPERFKDSGQKLDSLQDQMGALDIALQKTTSTEIQHSEAVGSEQEIMHLLMEKLKSEKTAGTVSLDRATSLENILTQFTGTMAEGGDDLASMSRRVQKMRDLTKQAMDAFMSPSWSTSEPESDSRAYQAISIIAPLKRFLLAEKGRSMMPAEEAGTGTDLLTRLIKLEACIREAAADDARVSSLEGEVWRLALEVQEHGRRYHLMVARPDFKMLESHATPKCLFLSGGDDLLSAANMLTSQYGFQIYHQAHQGDYAQERWNQLCSASVAVFDVGVPQGKARAQVCYEFGLALALGKPSVVATRPEQWLPFDVDLLPIRLSGNPKEDADELGEAIRHALGSIVWGGAEAGLGAGTQEALTWLNQHFHQRLSESSLRIAVELTKSNQDDAVAFRRSINQLLGMLGGDAPAVLLPAWPPAYPESMPKPRCFHVMPFRPDWAKPTRDLAASICDTRGWIYSRGDEADAQRIILGIWKEIGHASAVLVDITGCNPNVALELGLVHALGRPYRIVAQGEAKENMFESLEKVQIHSYGAAPGYSNLANVLEDLLESATNELV